MPGREDFAHLESLPSNRIVTSFSFAINEEPPGGALMKLALLGGSQERCYLPLVAIRGLILCCKRYMERFPGPPGERSAIQWFESHQPTINQSDFDATGDHEMAVENLALARDDTLVIELSLYDGSKRAFVLRTDLVFYLYASLGQVEAGLPRPPHVSTH